MLRGVHHRYSLILASLLILVVPYPAFPAGVFSRVCEAICGAFANSRNWLGKRPGRGHEPNLAIDKLLAENAPTRIGSTDLYRVREKIVPRFAGENGEENFAHPLIADGKDIVSISVANDSPFTLLIVERKSDSLIAYHRRLDMTGEHVAEIDAVVEFFNLNELNRKP